MLVAPGPNRSEMSRKKRRTDSPSTIYAVVNYKTRRIVYLGLYLGLAASALTPGTTWGKGRDDQSALKQAYGRCDAYARAMNGASHAK